MRCVRTFRIYINGAIEENLPQVPVPTLVVRGALDPIVPDRWATGAVDLLPRGSLAVIPGSGHTANYSAPLEIDRVARIFDEHSRHSLTDASRYDEGDQAC